MFGIILNVSVHLVKWSHSPSNNEKFQDVSLKSDPSLRSSIQTTPCMLNKNPFKYKSEWITLGDHTFLGEGVAEEATSCPKGCNMWRPRGIETELDLLLGQLLLERTF